MTVCERIQDDLKAYLDGELFWLTRWSIRRHVAGCADCRQELSEMEALQVRLRASDPGEMPAELRARILAAIPDVPVVGDERGRFRFPPSYAWGAAACAVLLFVFAAPLFTGLRSSLMAPSTKGDFAQNASKSPSAGAPAADWSASGGSAARTMGGKARLEKTARSDSDKPLASTVRKELPVVTGTAAAPGGGTVHFAAKEAKPVQIARSDAAMAQRTGFDQVSASKAAGKAAAMPGLQANAGFRKLSKDHALALSIATSPAVAIPDGTRLYGRVNDVNPGRAMAHELSDLPTIISTATSKPIELTLFVDNVAEKRATILALAKDASGQLETNLSTRSTHGEEVTFNVPLSKLTDTLAKIQAQGDVVREPLSDFDALIVRQLDQGAKPSMGRNEGQVQREKGVLSESVAPKGQVAQRAEIQALGVQAGNGNGNGVGRRGASHSDTKGAADRYVAGGQNNGRQQNGAAYGVPLQRNDNLGFIADKGAGALPGGAQAGGGFAFGGGGAAGPEAKQVQRGDGAPAATGGGQIDQGALGKKDATIKKSFARAPQNDSPSRRFGSTMTKGIAQNQSFQGLNRLDVAQLNVQTEAEKLTLPPAYWMFYSQEARAVEQLNRMARVTVKLRLKRAAPPSAPKRP